MIRVQNLTIQVPGFQVAGLNLQVEPGEFFVVLGPTGSGKTLILEAVAGLTPISSGQIIIGGRDVTRENPERRGVGVVYQDSALFPHLTVRQNITYGFRYQKQDRNKDPQRLRMLVERLGIGHILNRSVTHLSGGEKQRVALARALATAPDVLLLDEPLSSLDPAFREEVRRALKDLHQDLGLTFLLVTHDFTEALFLAQRAAVIAAGRLQQTGSVQDIFRSPATPFVAHFVGMKNVLPAAFNGPHARVGNLNVTLDPPLPQHARPTHIGIRPEDVLIGPPGQADGQTNTFPGQVQHVSPHGLFFELGVELNGATLSVITPGNDLIQLELAQGASVSVTLPPSKIHPL